MRVAIATAQPLRRPVWEKSGKLMELRTLMHDFAKSVSLTPEHESSKDTKLNINSYCIKVIIKAAANSGLFR